MNSIFNLLFNKNTKNKIGNQKPYPNPILKNSDLQKEIDNVGFIKIKILTEKQITEIRNFYNTKQKSNLDKFGFHTSVDLEDINTINEIAEFLKKNLEEELPKYFTDYQIISPRFIIKDPNLNSLIPPHQDWSFVDETQFQSYNLWISITPTTIKSGTLGFLKNSHNKLSNIRATPLPIFKVPFHDYSYKLLDKLEYYELNAGEAFLFNSRIIHASKPNETDSQRIVIASEITNKDAQLIHYNLQPDNKTIYKYHINNSFFSRYNNKKLTKMFYNKENIEGFNLVSKFTHKVDRINLNKLIN